LAGRALGLVLGDQLHSAVRRGRGWRLGGAHEREARRAPGCPDSSQPGI
jgi:hypothetical protein